MKFTALLAVLALVFLATGCYTLEQVGGPTEQKVEISNVQKSSVAGSFTTTKTVNHFVFGLINTSPMDIGKIAADEARAKGGKAAVNVRVHYQATFVNGLLSMITLGIYNPFTLTVSGDVVK